MLKNLNSRERGLAFALVGVLFVLLNFYFVPQLLSSNRERNQKAEELQAQLAAAKKWIEKKDYWNEREDWLEKTEPALNAARKDNATQLEHLQQMARESELQISDIQLLQLEPTEFYQPVGVRLTLTGTWSGLVRFISGLQEPELFDVIPRFSVRSEDPPPNVRCELEIQRWFHTPPETSP